MGLYDGGVLTLDKDQFHSVAIILENGLSVSRLFLPPYLSFDIARCFRGF